MSADATGATTAVRQPPLPGTGLVGLGSGQVSIEAGFWAERRAINRDVSLHHAYEELTRSGAIAQLEAAADGGPGPQLPPVVDTHVPKIFDSNIYVWLEAVAWAWPTPGDEWLEAKAETAVLAVVRAQYEDGFLDSWVRLNTPDDRWGGWVDGHVIYNAGHFFQAAVAWSRARSDRRLLEVARRLADRLNKDLAEMVDVLPAHPGIESALVELFRETGERRYLMLAADLLQRRGYGRLPATRLGPHYFLDEVPVREARAIRGHAVMALYLLHGMVDVGVELDDQDLLDCAIAQWDDMVTRKSYLTGGVGSRHYEEAVGGPFELPPDRAYCETCAAVASVMLGWRLYLATGRAAYAEAIEQILHNALLVGVNLEGTRFTYVNPLQVRAGNADARQPWFECACCPPNLMRLFGSLEHYAAAVAPGKLELSQLVPMTVQIEVEQVGDVALKVSSDLPWGDGTVEIEIESSPEQPWCLSVRVPGWCHEARVLTPGDERTLPGGDWLQLTRSWRPGDRLSLSLAVTEELIVASGEVDAVRDCAAVRRGPLIFCFEQADEPEGSLGQIIIDPSGPVTRDRVAELGGAPRLSFAARRRTPPPESRLYAPLGTGSAVPQEEGVVASCIPYHCWANRGAGEMRVWMRLR